MIEYIDNHDKYNQLDYHHQSGLLALEPVGIGGVGLHARHLEGVSEGAQRVGLPDVPHLALDITCTSRTEVRDEAEVKSETHGSDVIPVDSYGRKVGLGGIDGLHSTEKLHIT